MRITSLAVLAALLLAGCGEVQVNSGPPVAGTTPSTFSQERREAARITQESQGLSLAPR